MTEHEQGNPPPPEPQPQTLWVEHVVTGRRANDGDVPARFVTAMLATASRDEARAVLARWLPGLAHVDAALLFEIDGNSWRRWQIGSGMVVPRRPDLPLKRTFAERACAESETLAISDTSLWPEADSADLAAAGLRSAVFVPVLVPATTHQVLVLANHDGACFDDACIARLEAAAALLAVQERTHQTSDRRVAVDLSAPNAPTGAFTATLGLPATEHARTSSAELTPSRSASNQKLKARLVQSDVFADFQPVFRYPRRELIGIEALARWRSDEITQVAAQFLAHSPHLRPRVTRRVAERAAAMIRYLHDAGSNVPPVSVNTPLDMLDEMISWVDNRLLPTGTLACEVPFAEAAHDLVLLEHCCRRAEEIGLPVIIDDVTDVVSGLQDVLEPNISAVKLSIGLVHAADVNPTARATIERIIGMARRHSVSVMAKGVETSAQAELLREMGVSSMQGYLMLPPLPEAQLRRYLAPVRRGVRGEASMV